MAKENKKTAKKTAKKQTRKPVKKSVRKTAKKSAKKVAKKAAKKSLRKVNKKTTKPAKKKAAPVVPISTPNVFTVTFICSSEYEEEKENLEMTFEKVYHASGLENLFGLIEQEIENDSIDDSICINPDAQSELISTNIDYVKITDSKNTVVYQQ